MTRECQADGCKRPLVYRTTGLCVGHYRRYERLRLAAPDTPNEELTALVKSSALLRRRRRRSAMCEQYACRKDAVKRGYCNAHYTQRYREGTLPPVPRKA